MSKSLNLSILLIGLAGAAAAQDAALSKDGGYGLGRAALPEEVAAWNIDVRPDGHGLPDGSGDVLTGEEIYVESCAACHGAFGEAVGRWPVLAGGDGTMDDKDPVKTVGSYWPYLSTVYDYIHRAMPFGHAQSMDADQTYALTAYILYLNDMVDDDFTLTKDNFTEIQMANVDNFIDDDRPETELALFSADACMENCKDSVEITMHASVLDVTPEETAAKAAEAPAQDAAPAAEPETEAEAEATAPEATPAQTDAALAAPAAPAPATEPDPALVAAGEKAFRQCKSCHLVGEGAKNRVGPQLNGIMGRTIGVDPDFRYSDVLEEAFAAGQIWDNAALHAFLANPKDAMPGTKMSFRGVRDTADIDAIIAYLQSEGN